MNAKGWRRAFTFLLALLPSITLGPGAALAAAASETCARQALRAVGQFGKSILSCESKAARTGVAADQACVDASIAAFQRAFQASVAGGVCVSASIADVTAIMQTERAAFAAGLRPSGGSRCAAMKLAAVAKAIPRDLKLLAKLGRISNESLLRKARKNALKFAGIFAKAELAGGCASIGDASLISREVSRVVSEVAALPHGGLAPLLYVDETVNDGIVPAVTLQGAIDPSAGGRIDVTYGPGGSSATATIDYRVGALTVMVGGATVVFRASRPEFLEIAGVPFSFVDALRLFGRDLSSGNPPPQWTVPAQALLVNAALVASQGWSGNIRRLLSATTQQAAGSANSAVNVRAETLAQRPVRKSDLARGVPRDIVGDVARTLLCGSLSEFLLTELAPALQLTPPANCPQLVASGCNVDVLLDHFEVDTVLEFVDDRLEQFGVEFQPGDVVDELTDEVCTWTLAECGEAIAQGTILIDIDQKISEALYGVVQRVLCGDSGGGPPPPPTPAEYQPIRLDCDGAQIGSAVVMSDYGNLSVPVAVVIVDGPRNTEMTVDWLGTSEASCASAPCGTQSLGTLTTNALGFGYASVALCGNQFTDRFVRLHASGADIFGNGMQASAQFHDKPIDVAGCGGATCESNQPYDCTVGQFGCGSVDNPFCFCLPSDTEPGLAVCADLGPTLNLSPHVCVSAGEICGSDSDCPPGSWCKPDGSLQPRRCEVFGPSCESPSDCASGACEPVRCGPGRLPCSEGVCFGGIFNICVQPVPCAPLD